MVQRVRRINTKKGAMMAFLTLEGPGGTVDVIAFPRTFERFKSRLVVDQVLVVSGKLDNRADREEHSFLADWFKSPHELLGPVASDGYPGQDNGYAAMEPPAPYGGVVDAPPPVAQKGNGKSPHTAPVAVAPDPPSVPARTASNEGNGSAVTPPPEEPPAPPSTLYITLKRTGNTRQDFDKLARLHHLLKTESGQDNFVVLLEDGARRVELSFPNERTRYSPQLKEQVVSLIGTDAIRVIMAI
jgi:hypothetical protein